MTQARLPDLVRRHPRLALASVAGAAVLVGVALGLAILAFGERSTADASPTPGPSANASTVPSSTVSEPSGSPPPDDGLLQVAVDRLRMRATASTSADIVRVLDRGEVLRIESGPVEAQGYTWYEVVGLDSQLGWVATGDSGALWLEAVPTEPATSELLLRFQRDCDASPRRDGDLPFWPPDLTVTADGRVVTWGAGDGLGSGSRLVVRRLSPSGMAQLQRDVLDLPALQVSATFDAERIPDAPDPPGHGVCINEFALREATARVDVTAVFWMGEEEGVYWVPSAERRALDELAAHLADVETWLGPAAWSEPIARPYVSNSYLFWLDPPNDLPPPDDVIAPSVSGAAWPFDGSIEEFGEPAGQARCGHLDVGQAFETLRLMRELGVPAYQGAADPPSQLSLDVFGISSLATDTGWFSFWLTPRHPDGYPSCAA